MAAKYVRCAYCDKRVLAPAMFCDEVCVAAWAERENLEGVVPREEPHGLIAETKVETPLYSVTINVSVVLTGGDPDELKEIAERVNTAGRLTADVLELLLEGERGDRQEGDEESPDDLYEGDGQHARLQA